MSSHDLKAFTSFEKYNNAGKLIETGAMTSKPSSGHITLTIKEKDGTIDKEIIAPFSSFVNNFISTLRAKFTDYSTGSTNIYGGVESNSGNYLYLYNYDSLSLNDTYNIVVGTDDGTTYSHAYDNYKLGDRIEDGTGTGELSYEVNPGYSNITYAGGKLQFSIDRTFTNNSGGTISVKEIGIYGYIMLFACLVRDILPGTLSINDGQVLTVTYTFKFSEAEGFINNFVSLLRHNFFWDYPSITAALTQIDGSALNLVQDDYTKEYWRTNALYGEDQFGIQVGTSTSGISYSGYMLDSAIPHGSGLNELTYNGHYYAGPTSTVSGSWTTMERAFINNTTSGITIEEVGLVGKGQDMAAGNGILFIRNLTGGIVLQPTETINFKIKFEANI